MAGAGAGTRAAAGTGTGTGAGTGNGAGAVAEPGSSGGRAVHDVLPGALPSSEGARGKRHGGLPRPLAFGAVVPNDEGGDSALGPGVASLSSVSSCGCRPRAAPTGGGAAREPVFGASVTVAVDRDRDRDGGRAGTGPATGARAWDPTHPVILSERRPGGPERVEGSPRRRPCVAGRIRLQARAGSGQGVLRLRSRQRRDLRSGWQVGLDGVGDRRPGPRPALRQRQGPMLNVGGRGNLITSSLHHPSSPHHREVSEAGVLFRG